MEFDPQYTRSHSIKQKAPSTSSSKSGTNEPVKEVAKPIIEETLRAPVSIHLPPAAPMSTTEESASKPHTAAHEVLGIIRPAPILPHNATLDQIKRYLDDWTQEAPHENREAIQKHLIDFLDGKIAVLNFENVESLPDIFYLDCFNRLEYLDIDSTSLATLPPSLAHLTHLTSLTLNMPLTTLPEFMRHFTELTTLTIHSRAMTLFPAVITELTHLTELTLAAPFSQVPDLSLLTRLDSLNLSDCQELVTLPPEIGQLPKLQHLHLCRLPKLTQFPQEALNPHLQSLKLTGCANLITVPEGIGTMPDLRTLSLDGCPHIRLPHSLCTIQDHVLTIQVPFGTMPTCAEQYLRMLVDQLTPPQTPPLTIEVHYKGGQRSLSSEQAVKKFLMSLFTYLGKSFSSEDRRHLRDIGTLLSAFASNEKGYKIGHIFSQHFYAGLSYLLSLSNDGTPLSQATLTENMKALCLVLARADVDGPNVYGERLFDIPENLLENYDTRLSKRFGRAFDLRGKDTATKNMELFKMWKLFNTSLPTSTIRKLFPTMEAYIGSQSLLVPRPAAMTDFSDKFRKALTPANREIIERAILDSAQRYYQSFCAPLLEIAQAFDPAAIRKMEELRLLEAGSQGKALQALVETDPTLEAVDENGKTALMRAIEENDLFAVQNLLSAGANINACDKDGRTPLMLAAYNGLVSIVEMLLSAGGAIVNKCDKNGHTALMLAVLNTQADVAKLLVDAGSSVNARNLKGDTALSLATIFQPPSSTIPAMLQEHGADQEYASGFLEDIFIAHVWGLPGNSTRQSQPFELERMQRTYALKRLHTYTDQFLSQNVNETLLTRDDKNEIKDAIASAYPVVQDHAQMLLKIQSNQPVVILGGSETHAVSMVIFQNRLFLCNRGEERKAKAVEVYDLSALTNPQDLQTLLRTLTTTYDKTSQFNASVSRMISDFNLPHLREEDFDQKSQKIGNCSWASAKGALGILLRLYAQKNGQGQHGKNIYKHFTSWARTRAMQHYIQSVPAKSYKPNPHILQKIIEKLQHKRPLFAPQARELLKQALLDQEAA